MKKLIYFTLFLTITCSISEAQFTGCFAPANWAIHTKNTTGFVYIMSGGMSIQADADLQGNGTGTNIDCDTNGLGNVSACIIIPATGKVIYDWQWSGGLNSTFTSEPFGYCLNGVPKTLTSINPPPWGTGAGTDTINVIAGDELCFVVSSQSANSPASLATHVGVNNFKAACTSSVFEKLKRNELNVFPNPTSGKLTFHIPNSLEMSGYLEVTDITGKSLFIQSTSALCLTDQLNLEYLEPGIYFLTIKTSENQTSQLIQIAR